MSPTHLLNPSETLELPEHKTFFSYALDYLSPISFPYIYCVSIVSIALYTFPSFRPIGYKYLGIHDVHYM